MVEKSEELLDKYGNRLKQGFYYDELFDRIIFYTGQEKDNRAQCQSNNNNTVSVTVDHARVYLKKIKDPKKYIETQLENLEWMEQKLGKLEEKTPELPLKERETRPPHIFMLDPELSQDYGPFGKNPFKRDDGFVHPHKRY